LHASLRQQELKLKRVGTVVTWLKRDAGETEIEGFGRPMAGVTALEGGASRNIYGSNKTNLYMRLLNALASGL
jgi:hypothetical protein